jgi:hypothetical protein
MTGPLYGVIGASGDAESVATPSESTVRAPGSTEQSGSVSEIRASFAAGAAAGLLPFDLSMRQDVQTLLSLHPMQAPLAARLKRSSGGEPAEPRPAGHGGGSAPRSPSRPPGSASAGSAGTSAAGSSSGLGCAVLVGLLAFGSHKLRRHRVRPAMAGPVGVVSLLQQPG